MPEISTRTKVVLFIGLALIITAVLIRKTVADHIINRYGQGNKYNIKPSKGDCITKKSITNGADKFATSILLGTISLWAICYFISEEVLKDPNRSVLKVYAVTLLFALGLPALLYLSAMDNFFPSNLILKKYFSLRCST